MDENHEQATSSGIRVFAAQKFWGRCSGAQVLTKRDVEAFGHHMLLLPQSCLGFIYISQKQVFCIHFGL